MALLSVELIRTLSGSGAGDSDGQELFMAKFTVFRTNNTLSGIDGFGA